MTKYQMLLSLGELLAIDTAHLIPELTPMDMPKGRRTAHSVAGV